MSAPAIEAAIDIKGYVEIDIEECKGCALCVEACAQNILSMAPGLNRYGYHTATNSDQPCSGCSLCYYVCPEPGAIKVYKAIA